jgi:hypothetical protein
MTATHGDGGVELPALRVQRRQRLLRRLRNQNQELTLEKQFGTARAEHASEAETRRDRGIGKPFSP